MPDDTYSVKVNRREGIVEITGPDKDWIAAQLDRLAVVYAQEPLEAPPQDAPDGGSGDVSDETGTARKSGQTRTSASEGEDGAARRRGKGGYRGKRNQKLAEKLTPEVQAALDKYVEERRPNFTEGPNQAAILAAYLHTELAWDPIAPDDLYTVYDMMGWPGPNPRSALQNAKNRKNYFTSAGRGAYRLSHTGERFGRYEAKAASEQ